jgi:uncharacterized protein YqjF (DUF2071 family)
MQGQETIVSAAGHPSSKQSGHWQWSQRWRQLLFAHWQLPAEMLQRHLPAGLELDTFEGAAWVSVVAFRLKGVRLRGLPPISPFSNFLELNFRTYVRFVGQPAIYFLTIHAGNRLAVSMARCLTPLPYAFAQMAYERYQEVWRFVSHRKVDKGGQLLFRAEFEPTAEAHEAMADSLDAWLLERYFAYVSDAHRGLYRMAVQHPRWQVQDVTLHSATIGLDDAWGFNLAPHPDKMHFCEAVDALIWPFEKTSASVGNEC